MKNIHVLSKEEPKQETLEEVAEEYPKVFSENGDELFFDKQGYLIKEELSTKLHIGEVVDESYPKDFIKQEILEEAKKYAELSYYGDEVDAFVRGAKWQQEQEKNKYSEEEAFNMLMDFWKEERPGFKTNPVCVSNWFEQFKKK
jgi:hypothetical protein